MHKHYTIDTIICKNITSLVAFNAVAFCDARFSYLRKAGTK